MRTLLTVLLTLILSSCAPAENGSALNETASALGSGDGFVKNFEQVYFRGTANAWASKPMTLVNDNMWSVTATFGSTTSERFKFDCSPNWATNYGDNNADGYADLGGKDIAVQGGKTYEIVFNDASKYYSIYEKTYTANVYYSLPGGASVLIGKRARLYQGSTDMGTSYIYGDTSGVYTPETLVKGTYTLKLDQVISGVSYTGETSIVIDGTKDNFNITMNVATNRPVNNGDVAFTAYVDTWNGARIVSSPASDLGIYLGDWHAGYSLGSTDNNGKLTVSVTAGSQTFSAFKMTGSHSAVQLYNILANVVAGSTVNKAIHYASVSATINANVNPGSGYALYITGASSYLGAWATATKMTYNSSINGWSYTSYLPIGLPFKIIKAPWVNGTTIPTASGCVWEQGGNHAVASPTYLESTNNVTPSF